MRVTPSLKKKLLYAALFSISLATLPLSVTARIVDVEPGMCERAKAQSQSEVAREIGVVKTTHEKIEMERAAHAECMKQINQIVGEQISQTNSDTGILGIIGRINETFDIGGAVCNAIKDKMGDKYEKISSQIGKIDGLFGGASDILKQGKDAIGCVDCTGSQVDQAINDFIKKQDKRMQDQADEKAKREALANGGAGINPLTPGGGIGGWLKAVTQPSPPSAPATPSQPVPLNSPQTSPSQSSDPWDAFRNIFNP